MTFSRAAAADVAPSDNELTEAMAGIGMNFAARANHDADIEATLVAASGQGMLHDDLRTLAVLVTWLGVHARLLNADKLIRAVHAQRSPRVCAFWSAFANWQYKDRRFARLAKLHRGEERRRSSSRCRAIDAERTSQPRADHGRGLPRLSQ